MSYANCSGPFPFPNGALLSLSSPLAARLTSSAPVDADVLRTMSLQEQKVIYEDIWLGAALHRFLPHVPVAWVDTGEMHYFNGEWDVGRGRDRNTTTVYHNRRIRKVHQHVLEKQRLAVPRPPQLQCSVPADNAWEAAPNRRVFRYAMGRLQSFRDYFTDTGRLNDSSCVFVDAAELHTNRWVEWPPKRARAPSGGRGPRNGATKKGKGRGGSKSRRRAARPSHRQRVEHAGATGSSRSSR